MSMSPPPSLILLLLCTALPAGVLGIVDLDTHCSRPDDFPLHFDLFMELLSNHSSIARNLTRAPIFADMDFNSPAYEIAGRGFHFTDQYMSKDIKRALCSNNEVTFYSSMYLTKGYSSGTLLEISSGLGSRLPVFGVHFNAAAEEIMFTYRHRGTPHTVSVDQRLHTGRWRKYAFVLSGHLLQFYYECELVFSDIIPLPDFCVDETSFVVSFADDSDGADITLNNGIYAFFQHVGFYLGRGGLSQQCPDTGRECPTCGQYLKLVERSYALQAENDRLKARIEELRKRPERDEVSTADGQNCTLGDDVVGNGDFVVMDNGTICFCRNGELLCNRDMICQDNSTSSSSVQEPGCDSCGANENCVEGMCECIEGYSRPSTDGTCVEDLICENAVDGVDIKLGESYLLPDDRETIDQGDERCRVFTCQMQEGLSRPQAPNVLYNCQTIVDNGCGQNSLERNISFFCCNRLECNPCLSHTCSDHAHCVVVDRRVDCLCDEFYEWDENRDCVDVDECERGEHSCTELMECVNEEPGYRCECKPGYEMSQLGDCHDIDECESEDSPCPANSVCNNTVGSHECECATGYTMMEDGSCSPVCVEMCQNGGTCVAPETCACLPGYTGPLCVQDVDECATPNHMCTHHFSECVNTIGGHFCRCSAGYQGNGTFCEDINECESDIHNCVRRGAGSCVNTEGSFMCLCDNMMDCTGACRRRRVEYADGDSFIDSRDECSNCTCLNGEIFCHTRNCDGDCSDRIINKCCVKCASRDCYLNLEGVSEPVKIRPDSVFIHPMDPCTKWTCSSDLDLTHENVSSECPPLNCGEEFQVRQPGRCCRICLLPPCSSDMAGVTLPLHNGCKQCTCEAGSWNCRDHVTCPSSNCAYEDILFYNDQCCPVCESDLVGSTCRNFARNKSLFP